MKRIVLAYSGGLDTSVILAWLKEQQECSVIAVIGDVGQNEDFEAVRHKALATGADRAVVADLKQELEEEFVHPAVQGKAVYEDGYLLGTSLARPPLARALVRIALEQGARAIAHGATGKGNDQVRFELAFSALAPQLEVIAPWRTWDFEGRPDLLAYARARNIPISGGEKPFSMDANLVHISYEGGILEDPWAAPPAETFQMAVPTEQAPDDAEEIEISFRQGVPDMALAELNDIAGRHGVGRIDIVENRFVGIKSRGVYETPGVTLLHTALRAVESITMDREVMHLRDSLAPKFAKMIYNGFWFSPEMDAMLALVKEAQKPVTGTARMKLYKGHAIVTGRKAPRPLYSADVASFEISGGYSHRDAEGFIRLQGQRLAGCRAIPEIELELECEPEAEPQMAEVL